MNTNRIRLLTLIALAALAGCSSMPESNAQLESARSDYRIAQDSPRLRELAGPELQLASDALSKADASWTRHDSAAVVDHWAYIAKQRVAIAQETAQQKTAEMTVANANASRDKVRLAMRTNEADTAQRSAESAQRQAEIAKRDAEEAQRQSEAAQRDALAAQRQTSDAQARNAQLEAQIKDLNAKKTERGLVITIGDVLFDTNKSNLKAGSSRNVEKLAEFLKQYPQRRALVEGFTDSVGSESSNQELSSRRADAVRMALVGLGVSGDRISTRGYGKAYPVAGNDSADGRQLNRRVEIILSDESGAIAPR